PWVADARRPAAAAEPIVVEADHRIAHAEVLEVRDGPGVHDPRVVDYDVVDDPGTAAPAPVRAPREGAAAPPRDHGLTESERTPADERRADADRDADAGRTEERDQRRRIDGTHHDRTRSPAPEARRVDPPSVVIRRPTPRRFVD